MTESEDMTPATSEESVAVPDPSGRRGGGRHPSYNVMVKRAIISLKSKSGSSRKAIIRYICAHNNVKKTNCVRACGRALKRMLRAGLIYKNKGGRFKLTGKGRGMKSKKRRRRRARKGGRKRRRTRRKKGKKSKKGKKKKAKKSKRGRKRKGRKPRKARRGRRRRSRRSPKRANRRRKSPRRKKSRKGKKKAAKRRRR